MNIGIVTTWFERGAAYVSRAYMDNLVSTGHNVYIYARGGEFMAKNDPKWNLSCVTWGKQLRGTNINVKHFFQWIEHNNLDAILFNEQNNFRIVALTKKKYPSIKLCAYIDYYTEKLINWYNIYDFVICNTHRHLEAMESHPQSFYLRWGTDTDLFKPSNTVCNHRLVFFHSVGMSPRKGTDILIDAFIDGELYKLSKLILHTQIPINTVTRYNAKDLANFNIEVIEKTVTAPGLYKLGDVYVYPTRLDGLGLSIYEALSCGLPVITTNYPPMNEIIDDSVGKLVNVKRNYCRQDGYYWPMSICDKTSLIEAMRFYISNPNVLLQEKINARNKAEKLYQWKNQAQQLSKIFQIAEIRKSDQNLISTILKDSDKGFIYNWFRESEFATKVLFSLKGNL